ncbi:protocadherin Fat 4-like [Epinephelus lanceolatus]
MFFQSATHPQAPTLHFPVSSKGLRRRKRDSVIPPIRVVENDRGPYPMKVAQVYSDEKKIKKIYHTITGPGVDEGRIGLFTMDRDTGNLYLTQSLDREEQDKYTFQAHATYQDSSEIAEEPVDIVVIVVDQNDNKPAFTQDTFQGEVAEASPIGFEVIQVVATDLDQPDTDNSDIRYSIRSQEPTLPSDSLFVINPVTGVIRVNASGLDREKYPNYTLVVQAADMMGEGWIGEAKVILTVTDRNDNAPAPTLHFPVSSKGLRRRKRDSVIPPIRVVENDRGPYPMKVAQVYSDEKKIKKIYHTITGPGVDEGRIGLFTMDRDTGNLYLTQSLDREEQDKYTFQAHATYQDSSEIAEEPVDIVVIVVDQNDNKPAFTQDTFQGEVAEASPIGFEVIQVVATDLDQPDTDNSDIRYSIRSQEPTLPSDSLFVINPVTGVIRVNASGLDREKYPNYTLVVQAADMMGEGWIGEAKVILTVTDRNDNAPAFTQHSVSTVCLLHYNWLQICMFFQSATHPQAPTLHFPVSSKGLRRRKRDSVIPPIRVVENDRGPYPMKVAQVYSDEKKIKKIYHTITGPGVDEGRIGLFTMDRDTGNLYLTQSLDREEQDKYTFQAHATYQDSSEIAEEPVDIVVIVVDQNDNKPAFTQDTFQGEVAEASPIGFEVIQVVATDLDQPDTDNSDIRYSIRSQEPTLPSDSLFVINPVTGVIRVNASGLDREKYPNYTLVVQAADMMGEGWIGEAKVILTVTDRNDNAPAFTQHSVSTVCLLHYNWLQICMFFQSATHPQAPTLHFPVSSKGLRRRKRDSVIPPIRVVENDRGPYPMKVAQVYSDEKKIKKIYHTITGPGVDEGRIGLFTMDRDTGNLYLTQSLDREEQDKYTFQAHATYQDSSEIAEEPVDIVVIVVDQNDNKPAFTQDTFQGEVAEASPIGFEVIQVVATDLDQPDTDNSDIRYSIRSQEPTLPSDSLFVINPVTGVIRVNASGLDKEKYPNYTLVVQAADMMGEGWIGEAKVILTVTDRNDNAPAFTQHSVSTV